MDAYLEPVVKFFGVAWPLVWSLLKIVGSFAPLFLCVAYINFG